MIWWAIVLALFGLWIFSLATSRNLGGMVHGFLVAGVGIILFRTWLTQHPGGFSSPRPPGKRSPSTGGKPPVGPA